MKILHRDFVRRLLLVAGEFSGGLLVASAIWAQSPGVDPAKAAMEGNWRLEEWQADEELLLPPKADGRLSLSTTESSWS